MGSGDTKDWKTEIDKYDKQIDLEERQWKRYSIPYGINFDNKPAEPRPIAVNCYTPDQWRRMRKQNTGKVRILVENGRELPEATEITQTAYLKRKREGSKTVGVANQQVRDADKQVMCQSSEENDSDSDPYSDDWQGHKG